MTQNLLQGFGSAVNGRNIRVQKNNLKVTDLQFKQQLITTVSAVLNLYWDLVSFDEDVRARQRELDAAQQLLEDNKKQVQIGIAGRNRSDARRVAGIHRTAGSGDLADQLSAAGDRFSRTPSAAMAWPAPEPRRRAASSRSTRSRPAAGTRRSHSTTWSRRRWPTGVEIEQSQLNIESNKLNLVGIKNSLKPTLQAFAEFTNNGLTGDSDGAGRADPADGCIWPADMATCWRRSSAAIIRTTRRDSR